jgi:hypothetical protein
MIDDWSNVLDQQPIQNNYLKGTTIFLGKLKAMHNNDQIVQRNVLSMNVQDTKLTFSTEILFKIHYIHYSLWVRVCDWKKNIYIYIERECVHWHEHICPLGILYVRKLNKVKFWIAAELSSCCINNICIISTSAKNQLFLEANIMHSADRAPEIKLTTNALDQSRNQTIVPRHCRKRMKLRNVSTTGNALLFRWAWPNRGGI